MKSLMFHMDISAAMQFYERLAETESLLNKQLNEEERTNILLQMADEGLIQSVIGTNRTKEEIIKDAAKHGSVLHIDASGKKQIIK